MSNQTDPVASVERALSAIGDDPLNVFTAIDDRAVESARDPEVSGGPLGGLPVALKDLIDHAGRVTTAGSSFYRKEAVLSAPVVTRLEQAGAVIVGRTGLDEFAYGFSSENDWFGPVRNPWDPTTSPGGSSGGSAAAVAAGIVEAAIGTDTGGSVRVPAALCGCVGLKVTHGRVPISGVFPLAPSLDTVGPITTTVALATDLYRVMAGHDPNDPWSLPVSVDETPAPFEPSSLRVGIPHPWVDRPLDERAARGFESVVEALRGGGIEVVDVALPRADPTTIPEAAYAEVAAVHRRWFEADPERYGAAIRSRVARALKHDADSVTAAWRWRTGLTNAFRGVFADVDLLLTPTTAVLRKVIGVDTVDTPDGPEPYRRALSWFSVLVNQAGLPAIALPVADTSEAGHPPASVQFVAPWLSESTLLALGRLLEEQGVVAFAPPYS